MKKLAFVMAISFLLLALASNQAQAQDSKEQHENKKQQATTELIESRHYTFIPATVLPTMGPTKQLTPDFELKIRKDTLESYLPYFGKVYMASLDMTRGPLDFKTSLFKYTISNRKKGGWDIVIAPHNAGDTRELFLTVSPDGYASLQVICNNRDPISFNGYIQ
jgi:hypothetical protein